MYSAELANFAESAQLWYTACYPSLDGVSQRDLPRELVDKGQDPVSTEQIPEVAPEQESGARPSSMAVGLDSLQDTIARLAKTFESAPRRRAADHPHPPLHLQVRVPRRAAADQPAGPGRRHRRGQARPEPRRPDPDAAVPDQQGADRPVLLGVLPGALHRVRRPDRGSARPPAGPQGRVPEEELLGPPQARGGRGAGGGGRSARPRQGRQHRAGAEEPEGQARGRLPERHPPVHRHRERRAGAARGQLESIQDIIGTLKAEDDGTADSHDVAEVDENDSAIVRLSGQVILAAYQARASDIHVEPYGPQKDTIIRFRVDGGCRST